MPPYPELTNCYLYKQIQNECKNFVLHNVKVTATDKILRNLNVAKASV